MGVIMWCDDDEDNDNNCGDNVISGDGSVCDDYNGVANASAEGGGNNNNDGDDCYSGGNRKIIVKYNESKFF